ncbi:MAG: type 4a pilus biogenesis protein PilO [Candidatus Berkelbacteria bacterium]|nr:type 4a pilus biogenesis protein PilO [Candidatus Berkelbacteria bacterium]
MKKHSHIGLILLFVAIIGWFAVLKPQIDNFSAKALRVKALDEEVISYQQRLKDINEIKGKGEVITESLKLMYLAMPKSSQIPETLVMIESIASNSGVILSSATVGSPSDSQVPVTLSFGGNTTTVTKFLDSLYSNVRTATIKSQTITSDGSGNLNVSIGLGLVYQGGTP